MIRPKSGQHTVLAPAHQGSDTTFKSEIPPPAAWLGLPSTPLSPWQSSYLRFPLVHQPIIQRKAAGVVGE
jgi:hypothetical protein